jgi:hypothetical protein
MVKPRSLFLTLFVVAGSHAWTNPAVAGRRHPSSGRDPDSDSALLYRNGVEYHSADTTSTNNNAIVDDLDTNMRLQLALQAARDADRLFGLCTPASARAWRVVDEIYSSSSASREVEDNVKRVLGEEKSIWCAFQR